MLASFVWLGKFYFYHQFDLQYLPDFSATLHQDTNFIIAAIQKFRSKQINKPDFYFMLLVFFNY